MFTDDACFNRLNNVWVFVDDDLATGETNNTTTKSSSIKVCLFISTQDENVNSGYQKKPADAEKVKF